MILSPLWEELDSLPAAGTWPCVYIPDSRPPAHTCRCCVSAAGLCRPRAGKGLRLSPASLQLLVLPGPDSSRTRGSLSLTSPSPGPGKTVLSPGAESSAALWSAAFPQQGCSARRCSEGKTSWRRGFRCGIFQSSEHCSWQGII